MSVILYVEDEKEMARGIRDLLEIEQHEVHLAADGASGLRLFYSLPIDLVILDLMLPDMDGMDICRTIRSKNRSVPILMLTARSLEQDLVRGLGVGADDYVTKPFSVAELMARIRALLRRGEQKSYNNEGIQIGENIIDTGRCVLIRNETEIPLTFYEVEILKLLHAKSNQVVNRDEIFQRIWHMVGDPSNRTVDNFIVKLRKKLEKDQKRPDHLITVYGIGYKLIV